MVTRSITTTVTEEAYKEIYKLREKDKLIALQAMNKETINPSINKNQESWTKSLESFLKVV